jgi:hypothetical protein
MNTQVKLIGLCCLQGGTLNPQMAINGEPDEETTNDAAIQEDVLSIGFSSHFTDQGSYQTEEEVEIFPKHDDELELAANPNGLEDVVAPTTDGQMIQGVGMVTNWMVSK